MNWLKYKIIYFVGHVFFILLAIPFIFLTGLSIIFEEDPDKMMKRHKTEKFRLWALGCIKLAYCLKLFKNLFRRKNG